MRSRRVCIGSGGYRSVASTGMFGERGASRWTVGAWVAVLIGVVVALGWLGGNDDGGDGTVAAAGTTTTSAPSTTPSTAQPSTTTASPPTTTSGDHPLCGLHAGLTDAVRDHLPVQDAEDLEAFNTAQIEFHEAAVQVLDQPEQEAFASMLGWYQDLAVYYEALDWNPSPGLDVLVDNPPPQAPAEAVAVASRTLEDLCGVTPIQDQPAP